jgi:glycosyltransferase involved in cell wall biosynthesis
MISFVWPHRIPFTPWAGGSEVYTLSHLTELLRRRIPARIVTYHPSTAGYFAKYPDIPVLSLKNEAALSKLDDTLIFVSHPLHVQTQRPAYVILHNLIKGPQHDDSRLFAGGLRELRPIAPSKYVANYYKQKLDLREEPSIVYPGVDKVFSTARRFATHATRPSRVLFAGRPTQEKGPYVFLESIFRSPLLDKSVDFFSIETMNNNDNGEANAILELFKAHPKIEVIPPGKNRKEMADIYANHDIVIMPSSSLLWKEPFGMISIEAQHAGCRVVASHDGGLPETDCGNLILVRPDNPLELAKGIARAIDMGPLPEDLRRKTARHFTIEASVDQLLKAIDIKS